MRRLLLLTLALVLAAAAAVAFVAAGPAGGAATANCVQYVDEQGCYEDPVCTASENLAEKSAVWRKYGGVQCLHEGQAARASAGPCIDVVEDAECIDPQDAARKVACPIGERLGWHCVGGRV